MALLLVGPTAIATALRDAFVQDEIYPVLRDRLLALVTRTEIAVGPLEAAPVRLASPAPSVTVSWKPEYSGGPGICTDACAGFVPWEKLKVELEKLVFPLISGVPAGSRAGMQDSQGKKNWVVVITGPNNAFVGNVLFGTNPDNWKYDGLVHVAVGQAPDFAYSTFQRLSDGSYQRR